jgi:hypothetical protein
MVKAALFVLKRTIIPIVLILSPFILFLILDDVIIDMLNKLIFYSYFQNDFDQFLSTAQSIFGSKFLLNFILASIISIMIIIMIRKMNSKKTYNEGNIYFQLPLAVFWISSKLLNYDSVRLERIPVYMQFKLVIHDIFRQVVFSNNLEEISDEVICVQKLNFEKSSSELNILLSDTYILLPEKIPAQVMQNPTIIISRSENGKHIRCFSRSFVRTVRNELSSIGSKYCSVNIFPYTNAKHNYEIANDNCKSANRSNIKRYYVYQPLGSNYTFSKKKYLVN